MTPWSGRPTRASIAIPLLFICTLCITSMPAWGQKTNVVLLPGPPPLAAPAWLAPLPQARDQSAAGTPTQATSSYIAAAPPADIVSHDERQMRDAGATFQTRSDGIGVSIEASTEKISAVVRVREQDGGTKVNVSYALRRAQAPAASLGALPPLTLEWPTWLAPPGGRLVSQRTNPPGRIRTGSEDTCPGDVIGQPSQGCLKQTFESTGKLKDVYAHFDGLLTQYGYTTENPSSQPYANLQLGKWVSDVFASLTMRQYPQPQQSNYYRQINVFLRQPPSTNTRAEITFMIRNGQAGVAISQVQQPVSTPAPQKSGGLSFPPPRGTWRWGFQSVAQHRGSEVKYVSYYYETATDKSIEQALPLPLGGVIVGVFPDDCAFGALDDKGHSLKFSGQDEARDKALTPGAWIFYPTNLPKCGAVDVFVK